MGKVVDKNYRVIDESMRAAELREIENEELSRKVSQVTNSIECGFIDNKAILEVLENNNYNAKLTIKIIKGFKDRYNLNINDKICLFNEFKKVGGTKEFIRYAESYKYTNTKEDNSKDSDMEVLSWDDIYY